MRIDIETLRDDLREDCLGAFFAGGFGEALIDVTDIENASPQELIEIAERFGMDVSDYLEE